ncbi:MAG: DNA photolyase family protein [Bacteroidetes bacterium]|nr:DNA photolyase family protein [Bacteroidota bacterium]
MKEKISIFWFRRDLRLKDNRGLSEALKDHYPVLPIFIFDKNIIEELEENDPRITFIYNQLLYLSSELKKNSCSLYCKKDDPEKIWRNLIDEFSIKTVYTNEDYEPYAINRDLEIEKLLLANGIEFKAFKDQVIFAKNDILKNDDSPYTVFTPYKNKWIGKLKINETILTPLSSNESNYANIQLDFPSLKELGFKRSTIKVHDYQLDHLENYSEARNFPALGQTSFLSPHLRFGTISIRSIVKQVLSNQVFLSELIWREFFMQILYHYPEVVHFNFKRKYDHILWRNNLKEFEKWTNGKTGYPMVDAGMRELNATGYMHNRVRMVVAGFLCKHLLIDWKWGEAYFAQKLLDYELSSNNGNWQWAAGTGCDAAPYFRVFNPTEQIKRFDPKMVYIKKWIPELSSLDYPAPMLDHKQARERAIETYKKGLQLNAFE